MVYIDGKPTEEKCFSDVDIYKVKDGKIEKIIFNF